jgi:hypothetical protein
MHDECKDCLHGDKCPAANDENGECHGEWHFKSKFETEKAEAVLSNSTAWLNAMTDLIAEMKINERAARRKEREAQLEAELYMEVQHRIEIKIEKLKRHLGI